MNSEKVHRCLLWPRNTKLSNHIDAHRCTYQYFHKSDEIYTCSALPCCSVCSRLLTHVHICMQGGASRPSALQTTTDSSWLFNIHYGVTTGVCVCVCVCACVIGTRHGCTRRAPRWGWSRHCWWPRCSGPRTSSAASTWAWWRWTWCSDPNPPRPSPAPTRACAPCRPAGGDKHYYDWPQKSAAFQGNELLSAINYWMN